MKWRAALDRQFISRPGAMVLCVVSLLHAFQASNILLHATALGATATLEIASVLRLAGLPDAPPFVAVCLLCSAALGLSGAAFHIGWPRILLFVAQHFFLGVMAYGGIRAAWVGHYLDGTKIPGPHILNDQIVVSALFVIHFWAVLRRCWSRD